MYGMEYSQIIHPSGCIRQVKGLKKSLYHRISEDSHAKRHFKKLFCGYAQSAGIKSDRLLGIILFNYKFGWNSGNRLSF